MNDALRERFATLGQRIVAAEWERDTAVATVHALIKAHDGELSLLCVSELTTIPADVLQSFETHG